MQFVLQDFAMRVFESVSGIDRLTGRLMHGEQARCESVLLWHGLAGVIWSFLLQGQTQEAEALPFCR